MVIGGAAVAVVLVVAAVVGITQLGGDDDTDVSSSSGSTSSTEPSDGASDDAPDVMTASGADELRKQLTAKGWRCYDSLDKPAPVKQCYLWKRDGNGHTRGELSLQYVDEDSVGSIRFDVQSPSAVQGKIVKNVTALIGETLIGGNAGEVQKARTSSTSGNEVEGVYISGTEDGLNATVSSAEIPTVEPVPMPPVGKTRSAMERIGLHCRVDDGALVCEGAKDGVRLRAIGSLENGHISGGWTMSLSPGNLKGGKASKAARLAADVLRRAGLTDAAGAKFVRTHYQTDQQGDFAHYHVSVINSSSGSYYSLMVSVQEIR